MSMKELNNRLDRIMQRRGGPGRPKFIGFRAMTGLQWELEQEVERQRIMVEGMPAVSGPPVFTGLTLITSRQ